MATVIDTHLAKFDGVQRAALVTTRDVIVAALPQAEEVLNYGMPTFSVDGIAVVGFDGFTGHNSLFPYSTAAVAQIEADHPELQTSKGTVRFPKDKPIPATLLRKVIKRRIAEINHSFPKKSGEYRQFYANGALKCSGRYRGDDMTGKWRYYRSDGTLQRSGSYRSGKKLDDWETFPADPPKR
jgi:uncharacterized protein YdhG (YjbR/CyaY superfamily)